MNNEQVIEYVRATSNHPHAEKIIEWILTGCIVKYWHDYDNEWKETTTPGWNKDTKYLLFTPKPAKPAYRVYRVKHTGQTFTRDNEKDGSRNDILTNKSEWISDWIEYDPPKKWPTPLVERIAAIDIKAADMFTWIASPKSGFYCDGIKYQIN